jgi:hypothetical protein
MDTFEIIFNQIATYIEIPYLLIFMFLSYLTKDLVEKIITWEWRTVYTVLFIATIVAIPYSLLEETTWIRMVITYAVGASLHETMFRYIEKKFT